MGRLMFHPFAGVSTLLNLAKDGESITSILPITGKPFQSE